MEKILLTSGTSFCTDNLFDSNREIEKWPSLLSKKLNVKLINKSKPGASNLYIYDHLMENILKHENIELVVASWSYGLKTSIFRNFELNLINIEDQDLGQDRDLSDAAISLTDKIQSNGLIVSSIEQSLRLMIYLQDACDSKGIKCIHYPLLNLFKTNLEYKNHVKVLEQIIGLDTFQKLQSFDNIIGWPSDTLIGGYTYNSVYCQHTISKDNHHPNAQGQKIIADDIYDKYLKI